MVRKNRFYKSGYFTEDVTKLRKMLESKADQAEIDSILEILELYESQSKQIFWSITLSDIDRMLMEILGYKEIFKNDKAFTKINHMIEELAEKYLDELSRIYEPMDWEYDLSEFLGCHAENDEDYQKIEVLVQDTTKKILSEFLEDRMKKNIDKKDLDMLAKCLGYKLRIKNGQVEGKKGECWGWWGTIESAQEGIEELKRRKEK